MADKSGMTAVCLTRDCERERIPPVNGNQHAHCEACETRLLRESFGPVSWVDRALTNTLPPLIMGGSRAPAYMQARGDLGVSRAPAHIRTRGDIDG